MRPSTESLCTWWEEPLDTFLYELLLVNWILGGNSAFLGAFIACFVNHLLLLDNRLVLE